jgi:GNAT superfamily N-acetyltransferase
MLDALTNPVWAALTTRHRAHAIGTAQALRYPRDIAPFAALGNPGVDALQDLSSMLESGEHVWLVGSRVVDAGGLHVAGEVDCVQLVMPPTVPSSMTAGEASHGLAHPIIELSAADADDMVKLTTVAFPGFFRARTCLLGFYCGIRNDAGDLIAMAGERFSSGDCREISAVCTHPSWRGQGLASAVMWRLIQRQRAGGMLPWLHVAVTNTDALRLYRSMGFVEHATIRATRVTRQAG